MNDFVVLIRQSKEDTGSKRLKRSDIYDLMWTVLYPRVCIICQRMGVKGFGSNKCRLGEQKRTVCVPLSLSDLTGVARPVMKRGYNPPRQEKLIMTAFPKSIVTLIAEAFVTALYTDSRRCRERLLIGWLVVMANVAVTWLVSDGEAQSHADVATTCTHTHVRTHTHAHTHTHTHTRTHTHKHAHTHTHAHTRTHTNTHTHARTHAQTHTRTHMHAHMHTPHTHMRANTHTHSLDQSISSADWELYGSCLVRRRIWCKMNGCNVSITCRALQDLSEPTRATWTRYTTPVTTLYWGIYNINTQIITL